MSILGLAAAVIASKLGAAGAIGAGAVGASKFIGDLCGSAAQHGVNNLVDKDKKKKKK